MHRKALQMRRYQQLTEKRFQEKISKATILHELKRNQLPPGECWPDMAQSLTLGRKKRSCQLDNNQPLKNLVITKLCCHYWSPEAIVGWLKYQQNTTRHAEKD